MNNEFDENKNVSPYLNMTFKEMQESIDAMENILNKEYIELATPLYQFYDFEKNGILPEGMSEENLISESMKVREAWSKIFDLWNDSEFCGMEDGFMEVFNYPVKGGWKSKIIKFPKKEYLKEDKIKELSLEEATNLICPPAYVPNEIEILFRRYVYTFEESLWDSGMSAFVFFEISMKKRGVPGFEDTYAEIFGDEIGRESKNFKARLGMVGKKEEILNSFVPKDWFKKGYVEGLSDSHCGDCTAVACACMRCHSEDMFSVPETALWGKSAGYYLLNHRMNLNKKVL